MCLLTRPTAYTTSDLVNVKYHRQSTRHLYRIRFTISFCESCLSFLPASIEVLTVSRLFVLISQGFGCHSFLWDKYAFLWLTYLYSKKYNISPMLVLSNSLLIVILRTSLAYWIRILDHPHKGTQSLCLHFFFLIYKLACKNSLGSHIFERMHQSLHSMLLVLA